MSPALRDGPLGKLIVLQRARERTAGEALARAAEDEAHARTAEQAADDEARKAAAAARRAEEAPAGERPLGEVLQVLQLQGRFARSMRRRAADAEERRAAVRGERVTAAEAFGRVQGSWERTRRARERFEQEAAGRRREARRARERREEASQDDLPPRGER
jgi:hypothetical protein